MKFLSPTSLGTALGAGLIATVALLPQAKGELVYENNAARVDDRSTMRQALGASEKAQATLQVQGQVQAQPQVVQVQPQVVMTAPVVQATDMAPAAVAPQAVVTVPVETENLSKAELMRRERQREELKNEDILQERLEELRLRDERRRTDEVLGKTAPAAAAPVAMQPVAAPLKEEVVVAPVTENPGKPAMAPAMAVQAAPQGPAPIDSVTLSQSMSVAPGMNGVAEREERTMISVAPRAGLSNMVGNGGYFDVHPHYAAGLAAAIGASDYFSFQVGYTFNQYGVAMASSNPWAAMAQQQAAWLGQSNFQVLNMNQNVFDAGVKIHLTGMDSKIRPFLGAGGAYATSYINFASSILSQMNATYGRNISPDYTVNNFLGYLTAGMDFKVAKNISVGAEFRYYAVLSDTENGNFSNYYPVMYGSYSGYGTPMGVNPMNQDTAVAGGSLARNNFYSILGNVAFSF